MSCRKNSLTNKLSDKSLFFLTTKGIRCISEKRQDGTANHYSEVVKMRSNVANSNALTPECSLLYVFSPSPNDHLYQLQMEQIQERQNLLLGHDVVIAQVFEDRQGHIGSDHLPADGCNGLRRHYHIPTGRFRVLLVGKDDQIKLVADSCVSFEEVVMRVENEPKHEEISLES